MGEMNFPNPKTLPYTGKIMLDEGFYEAKFSNWKIVKEGLRLIFKITTPDVSHNRTDAVIFGASAARRFLEEYDLDESIGKECKIETENNGKWPNIKRMMYDEEEFFVRKTI